MMPHDRLWVICGPDKLKFITYDRTSVRSYMSIMLFFYFHSYAHRILINWFCCFYKKCEREMRSNISIRSGMSTISRSVGNFFSQFWWTVRLWVGCIFDFPDRVITHTKYIVIYISEFVHWHFTRFIIVC